MWSTTYPESFMRIRVPEVTFWGVGPLFQGRTYFFFSSEAHISKTKSAKILKIIQNVLHNVYRGNVEFQNFGTFIKGDILRQR